MTALALSGTALPEISMAGLMRRMVELLAPARAPEKKWADRLASIDAEGRFCGYASLFGRMDLAGDIVMPGAFAKTLRARGPGGVGMFLEHDPKVPIGVWDVVEEDRTGLWVEGRLTPSMDAARAARAMKDGALDGLSIGFRTIASNEDRSARVRRLTEIDLWEVSVVQTPMLPEARARARGVFRAGMGATPGEAADAGLIARMRREAANMLGMG